MKTERINLHEVLRRRKYRNALIATYTFGSTFFEKYCLERLNSLRENPNISILIDRTEYEKVILSPVSSAPSRANLRYLLHPISVAGVFHPKIYLFTRYNRGLLLLGSANLSSQGITSNAELMSCFEYVPDENEELLPLFRDVFQYFQQLCSLQGGRSLNSNIAAMFRESPWLGKEEMSVDTSTDLPVFLHNLDLPLWDQILSFIKPPVHEISIVSRFFDQSPALVERIIQELKPSKVKIYTQNGTTTLSERWLQSSLFQDGLLKVFLCTYKDGDFPQPLHAKAFWVQKDDHNLFAFGSANFTDPALCKTVRKGNAEVLLLFEDLAVDPIEMNQFFDPNSSAVELLDESDLVSAATEEWGFANRELLLQECWLEEDCLRLLVEIPHTLKQAESVVELSFLRLTPRQVQISQVDVGLYQAEVSDSMVGQLCQQSCVAKVKVFQGERTFESNPMLISNLQDLKTGRGLHRERRVREAEESAKHFIGVLHDLVLAGDEDSLRQFLTYCNIPVKSAPRPFFGKAFREPWDLSQGMRTSKGRNLQQFINLDDAVIYFVDRHFRKLQRHMKHGTVEGISNFLHIFLAICGVLESQIERAVCGFEELVRPISTEEWHKYRALLDRYLSRFRSLVDCLWTEYLSSTLKGYSKEKIREEFLPDLEKLESICLRILDFRNRIEEARRSKIKVLRLDKSAVTPGYFGSILDKARWNDYSSEIRGLLGKVLKRVG